MNTTSNKTTKYNNKTKQNETTKQNNKIQQRTIHLKPRHQHDNTPQKRENYDIERAMRRRTSRKKRQTESERQRDRDRKTDRGKGTYGYRLTDTDKATYGYRHLQIQTHHVDHYISTKKLINNNILL
jgi:hypothetical protein